MLTWKKHNLQEFHSNLIPWARGISLEWFMVIVDLLMYCFQASLPDSLPPPVCFSPPNAPPISAPDVDMLTFIIPQSDPLGPIHWKSYVKKYIYNLIAQMIYLIFLTRSWMKKTFHVFFRTRIFEFNNSISIKTEKEQEGAYTYVYIMEIFIHITVYGSIYRL